MSRLWLGALLMFDLGLLLIAYGIVVKEPVIAGFSLSASPAFHQAKPGPESWGIPPTKIARGGRVAYYIDLPANSLIVGVARVTKGEVALQITSPGGSRVYFTNPVSSEQAFAFISKEPGKYEFLLVSNLYSSEVSVYPLMSFKIKLEPITEKKPQMWAIGAGIGLIGSGLAIAFVAMASRKWVTVE